MLTKVERSLVFLASLLLALSLALPLWRIEIGAPQYPEGLAMIIGLDRISGNVDQINILNHYIGMKAITATAIPELRVMPGVVMALAALGALAALIRRRWAVGVWFATFATAGAVGLYDFWKWGYDYGHNLNPDAPIQLPGMTYQPPLIGHKLLLNIDAWSYPDLGGLAIGVAMAFGALALSGLTRRMKLGVPSALGALLMTGCTSGVPAIEPGVDVCHACKMTITETRFGGAVVTGKGRVEKYDSIGCLLHEHGGDLSSLRAIYVSDYFSGKLVESNRAGFVQSGRINGPMGQNVAASVDAASLEKLRAEGEGRKVEWADLDGL